MILGLIYVVCKIVLVQNYAKEFGPEAIFAAGFLFATFWLVWLDMVQKSFLCSLIFKIRQLIKEDDEEPEDC